MDNQCYKKIIKIKNKLYRLELKNPSNVTFARDYKIYRNKLTHVKEHAKRQYDDQLIQQNMHNSRKVWKTVNEILNKVPKRNNLCIHQIFDNKGMIYTDPHAISNAFNHYFAEVGSSMAKNIPLAKSNYIDYITSTSYSFYLSPITEKEILYHIRNLKSTKCTGINNIPIKFIKIASVVITRILTNLYNNCISKGFSLIS